LCFADFKRIGNNHLSVYLAPNLPNKGAAIKAARSQMPKTNPYSEGVAPER
jgi:hypothetical protein